MDFGLTVDERNGRVVVTVAGDLDILTGPELLECLIGLIEEGRTALVVDLRPTTFMDSSGLSALLVAVKRARGDSGDVVLVCLPGNVRRVIHLVALDQVFEIYDSVDDAIAPRAPATG